MSLDRQAKVINAERVIVGRLWEMRLGICVDAVREGCMGVRVSATVMKGAAKVGLAAASTSVADDGTAVNPYRISDSEAIETVRKLLR